MQSSSARISIPLLNMELELGMCDEAILTRLFADLESTPEALLPATMDQLRHTAFLLWKCGWGEFAKRLLFTCLAWYLKNSKDQDMISTITGDIQFVFEKYGVSQSREQIHQAAIWGF
jgi:hypothetical protein